MLKDEETQRTAANFKRLRLQKGWTLYETGQHRTPPVTLAYVSAVERGATGVGKRARIKWAKVFGVDVSEFLKPLDANELDREISLLNRDAIRYGIEQIKRLRQLMPLLLEEGGSNVSVEGKKKLQRDHSG
jgi:transcriptional regulator with XRE-family HTH domain